MKLVKTITMTAAVLGAAVTGNAQTVIDITGSTAGRSAVQKAIQTVLSNETFVFNTGKTITNCDKSLFKGDIGGNQMSTVDREGGWIDIK